MYISYIYKYHNIEGDFMEAHNCDYVFCFFQFLNIYLSLFHPTFILVWDYLAYLVSYNFECPPILAYF